MANLPTQQRPHSRLLTTVFDEQNLRCLTTRISNEKNWVNHVNKKSYQGTWDVLALRCIREHRFAHPILQCFTHDSNLPEENWENLPLMEHYPEVNEILKKIPCTIKSVRFMRLRAGAKILPHRDNGVSLEYGEARLHVPIISSSEVSFFVSENEVLMNPGELWYIDADQVHSVVNSSSDDRIHLVIDCISNSWLKNKVLND
ncbi:aspartyl/asparaginyl beta-hydroxylase domain-containing protein [Aliikangiella coralliicola]|uniref:Aspartyl/asparaginyl beta-hydroxylase domain-containing protein n=1 Tax=Aliikangiella coralliicola TaxID=2592383 RepID=A0A545U791_9GAMM|nr:aspartyl/asparaginyl beta-hydroxylase domain-containing protein [Aliikangiella coralliicola]TQV85341.1 aspartyl/asparaginyl beta-hydroxylase domain-containing protein [Aliikangiella coralliicola]